MVPLQPSPELIAANERLLNLRAQYQAERTAQIAGMHLDFSTYREVMGGSSVVEKVERNATGGHYSLRF